MEQILEEDTEVESFTGMRRTAYEPFHSVEDIWLIDLGINTSTGGEDPRSGLEGLTGAMEALKIPAMDQMGPKEGDPSLERGPDQCQNLLDQMVGLRIGHQETQELLEDMGTLSLCTPR